MMADGPAASSRQPPIPEADHIYPTDAESDVASPENAAAAPVRLTDEISSNQLESHGVAVAEAETNSLDNNDAHGADARTVGEAAESHLEEVAQEAPTQASGAEKEDSMSGIFPIYSQGLHREISSDASDSEMPVPASEQPPHTSISREARPATTNAQHSSFMSFARTVSHEVSFNDDDAEWNLARSSAEAAGFTPPVDSGDAFQANLSLSDREDDVTLPPDPVLKIAEEAGREVEINEQRSQAFETDGTELRASSEPTHNWLGPQDATAVMVREVQGPETEAATGCNEEGVPLVSGTGEAAEAGNDTLINSFAHGIDDNDDFFSRSPEPEMQDTSPAPDTQNVLCEPITQVMGEQDHQPTWHHSTPKETVSDQHNPGGDTESAKGQDQPHVLSTQTPDEGLDEAQTASEDLTTKWRTAFAGDDGDDEFLLEDSTADGKDIDEAAFLGSDDEGLLEEEEEEEAEAVSGPQPAPAVLGRTSKSSSYTSTFRPLSSSYTRTPHTPSSVHPCQQPATAPLHPPPPQLRPEQPRAQSFVDKSKGSYSSPYDMPSDLISNSLKPWKRTSLQQIPREQVAPPPRSSSMYSQGRPATTGPPTPGPTPNQRAPPSVPRSQGSFFEDLPVTARPRPSSRQASMQPPPSPHAPAEHSQPTPPMTRPFSPSAVAASQPPGAAGLVVPESTNPYAAPQFPTSSVPPPSGATSKYSPTPPAQPGMTAPTAAHRYSPAPSGPRPGSSYNTTAPMTPSQPCLPHLPRTSSPLAHFEASSDGIHRTVAIPNGDAHHADRRVNSFDPRLNRVSSLPPTHEVDEEEDDKAVGVTSGAQAPHTANAEMKPSSAPYLPLDCQTPPPPSRYAPSSVSSPRRASTNYMPQAAPTAQPGFMPPPRPSTQSPVAMQRDQKTHTTDLIGRPSSAHASTGPPPLKTSQTVHLPVTRTRGKSLLMNMVPPTDGREHDPLERWKGAPVLAWGVGGTIVMSFPKSIPRYTMNQTAPTIMRTCGEVKAQSIKDIDPLAERLAKFPGPLKGKSMKKDALAWLAAGIDAQEKDLPDISFHPQLSLEAKRGVERLLLWKLLRVFIEFDGILEGSPAVEKAVQGVLAPSAAGATTDSSAPPLAAAIGDQAGAATSMMADNADPAAVEQIRLALLSGNRETAVWSAVDKRLWGHAMLISHTVSPDLYKQVAQEFVRKEVNYPGHNNESIATLYKVLSGNFDDCVDELVPIHARLGLQLLSKESTSGSTRDGVDGLDKWRETLTLILNNRSPEDVQGLHALGKLLSGYGRAEAAHICFLFSRTRSVFGGLDDQKSDFVLLGSDHRQQSDRFAKETEALQLSELYEYGLSLSGRAAATAGAPHLAAYKLQHAVTLTEYGYRDKALLYCDAIAAAMVSQTRRSSYHHAILEAAVDDFTTRLKQAPKDASSSWISKPSMNKVSDSMWNRFNKFVAGDGDHAGHGGGGETESGPFARVASTPNLSRSPSASNFDALSLAVTSACSANPAPVPNSAASSRYAPASMPAAAAANPYATVSPHQPAAPSSGRSSSEYPRYGYEPPRPGTGSSANQNSGNHGPAAYAASQSVIQPFQAEAARAAPNGALAPTAARPSSGGYRPHGLQESPNIYPQSEINESKMHALAQDAQLSACAYGPPQTTAVSSEGNGTVEGQATQGYEPPSYQPYGYEQPSYQPEPEPQPTGEDGAGASRPKKSFMDDDENAVAGLRPAAKSKADKDRENAEMFRKATEEDAKRAAAQQQGKKGWGFSGWFGGGKKSEPGNIGEAAASNVIQAKLGESSSFVYDPELKRWINKKAGAEIAEAKKATPPPPRAMPPPPARLSSSTPPMAAGRSSSSPLAGPPQLMPELSERPSQEAIGLGVSAMSRSASYSGLAAGPPSGPPSRPPTSMSNASSIDDLLSAAAPRKPGQRKPRKSGRYVDIMAK